MSSKLWINQLKIKHDCIKEIEYFSNQLENKDDKTTLSKFQKIIRDIMYAAGDDNVQNQSTNKMIEILVEISELITSNQNFKNGQLEFIQYLFGKYAKQFQLFKVAKQNFDQIDINFECNKKLAYQNEERAKFKAERVEQMNEDQYQKYLSCRGQSLMTLGIQGFSEFIKMNVSYKIGQLLSYCYGKLVQNIIEKIIKKKNNGKLKIMQTTISSDDIEQYKQKALQFLKKKILKRQDPFLFDKAFQLYKKEFIEENYHEIFSKSIVCKIRLKVIKSKVYCCGSEQFKLSSNIQKFVAKSWKKMSNYHYLWQMRIDAEKQFNQEFLTKIIKQINIQEQTKQEIYPQQNFEIINQYQNLKFVNQYAEYLFYEVVNQQNKSFINYSLIFKNFFLEEIQQKDPLLIFHD